MCSSDLFPSHDNESLNVSGNTLTSPITFKLSIPEQIETGDVFFNEVLFNPRSGGVPYIELSNVSEKVLPFNQLFLSYQKEDGTRSEPISLNCTSESFIPHTEIFFTNKIDKVSSQYKCDITNHLLLTPTFPMFQTLEKLQRTKFYTTHTFYQQFPAIYPVQREGLGAKHSPQFITCNGRACSIGRKLGANIGDESNLVPRNLSRATGGARGKTLPAIYPAQRESQSDLTEARSRYRKLYNEALVNG